MPYQPEGDPLTAKIVLIGEAPAKSEIYEGRPFVGAAGQVLNECLESAGILRSECYLTNVFDFMVKKGQGSSKANIYDPETDVLLWSPRSGLTKAADIHKDRLWQELNQTRANVIVPCGGPALEAVCGLRGITKWRGSIVPATRATGAPAPRKCVPTIHPANALYGMYTVRYIIRSDMERAAKESAFPEINRPQYEFPMHLTFEKCMDYLDWLRKNCNPIAVDIEVAHKQVSCIAYAWSPLEAVSIPYGMGGWSLQQEAALWRATAVLLEDESITKIFQNGAFDVQFLFQVHDILVQGNLEDTMIANHIMYADFPKSLAFLASIYTDQPYWKDMVKHGEIDKEDG